MIVHYIGADVVRCREHTTYSGFQFMFVSRIQLFVKLYFLRAWRLKYNSSDLQSIDENC
jgi:hypothetical protein